MKNVDDINPVGIVLDEPWTVLSEAAFGGHADIYQLLIENLEEKNPTHGINLCKNTFSKRFLRK